MKKRKVKNGDLPNVKKAVEIIIAVLVVSIGCVAWVAYKFPTVDFLATMSGIGTFFTAILTALYVYTTTQQIVIANNQLVEMMTDRKTQEQPLVVVDCEMFKINPPKMYYSPPEDEYSFCSQYYYETELKNESSFAAVSVDVTSELLIKNETGTTILQSSSKRIKVLSARQQVKISFLFLDEGKYSVYEALRQTRVAELPVVKTTIIYKNLCGACFKIESCSTVFPSMEDTEQLIVWHTAIATATTASKETIERIHTMAVDNPQRHKAFNSMKEAFEGSFEHHCALSIDCVEEPLAFMVKVISEEEFEETLSQHGYSRLVRGVMDCTATK